MSNLRPVIEGERIDQVQTLAGYLVVAVLSGHISTSYRLPFSHISTFYTRLFTESRREGEGALTAKRLQGNALNQR